MLDDIDDRRISGVNAPILNHTTFLFGLLLVLGEIIHFDKEIIADSVIPNKK